MGLFRFNDVWVNLGEKDILKGFSLELREGDKLLLTGKSGIGKSTVLRLLLGFVRPSKGEILYRDGMLNPAAATRIRRESAYVSQILEIGGGNVDGLIRQVLCYHANRHLGDLTAEKSRWMEFLEMRDGILHEEIETLSGGEKQRVAILIALLLRRRIFLLDEITAYLDQGLKDKVASLFLSDPAWTVISISHDPCWRRDGIQRMEMKA